MPKIPLSDCKNNWHMWLNDKVDKDVLVCVFCKARTLYAESEHGPALHPKHNHD